MDSKIQLKRRSSGIRTDPPVAIICASVFRLNSIGRLAALSLHGSKLSTDATGNYYLDDKHTYQSDGDLILRALICQIAFFLVFHCTAGIYFGIGKPKQ